MVYRVYAEKKPEYAVEALALAEELVQVLGIKGLSTLRILHRYDVEYIAEDLFSTCCTTVFSEPPVDDIHHTLPTADVCFAVSYLPGQFDQRADSAAECIQLISQAQRPLVKSAKVYLLYGCFSQGEIEKIKQYLINPVEAQEDDLDDKTSLDTYFPKPKDILVLDGFREMSATFCRQFLQEHGLAMDMDDLVFCQQYFRQEERDPSVTELRMIDTYWSDHCRHTTFGTHIDSIQIDDIHVEDSYQMYCSLRKQLYTEHPKPISLMDLATIGAKALKAQGRLHGVDESDEINACSVHIMADVNGKEEPWLLLFKNETHNHPTEIEPFGGAATCIGGAIRDPLANRGYVFGAMRLSGAANPLVPVANTLPGKLPQHKLVRTAAAGYSSYGNQIGLATGLVRDIYHPGYLAKHMELGAVLGAVPLSAVRREVPEAGDVVLLLGGATGRDGCGGATGSSKAHKVESLASCGAEVQKGNAPVERKLQRLFRNPEATHLIRRCNDFGAGGVSVAIGELADGIDIQLDAIPKKYEGLDGTELAISESQERMAVVVEAKDVKRMKELAFAENMEATEVATITDTGRLRMFWRGDKIVDLARRFLNSNGAEKHISLCVPALPTPQFSPPSGDGLQQKWQNFVADLSFCGQKGLAELFDSTIGAASLLMPFGGRRQLTPTQAMAMKLPVFGETTTCAGMSYGFDPFLSEQNPYTGAYLAVLESVARLVACGFSHKDIYLSFQEYFERLKDEPLRWGKPFAALLGALRAQMDIGVASIGGKDSMSGSFEHLDVPPTLVSFAVAAGNSANIHGAEFKKSGNQVVLLRSALCEDGLTPAADSFLKTIELVKTRLAENRVLSVWACGRGGVAEAVFNMGLGNALGLRFAPDIDKDDLFSPAYGCFVLELAGEEELGIPLGVLTNEYCLDFGNERVNLSDVQEAWEAKLEPVLPYRSPSSEEKPPNLTFTPKATPQKAPHIGIGKPRALVPVFPGTNCEYDTTRALQHAGADADVVIIRNRTADEIAESAALLAQKIKNSQMLIFPGGFSGGDEPEGSAKLIASFFRGAALSDAVHHFLAQQDGLILGICNGFQALIKLGLVPYGCITPPSEQAPTLTFNRIGRHQSMLVRTRVCSSLSPWLSKEPLGSIHTIPVSHGEGRFIASPTLIKELIQNGQVATQYVDFNEEASMDIRFNPAGSVYAIEGITSLDGRIFGKMAHSERSDNHLYRNVEGNKHQMLFEGGVSYFTL